GECDPKRQPVLITVEDDNLNGANVFFLVGGAAPPAWSEPATKSLTRVVMMCDGRDGEQVGRARTAWSAAKAAGHDVTYWKESAAGKFEKQAWDCRRKRPSGRSAPPGVSLAQSARLSGKSADAHSVGADR